MRIKGKNKRFLAVLLVMTLLFSQLPVVYVSAATRVVTVTVYYHRSDGNYQNNDVWIGNFSGAEAAAGTWNEHFFGRTRTYTVSEVDDKEYISFKLPNDSVPGFRNDLRYLDPEGANSIEVWLVDGDPRGYDRPKPVDPKYVTARNGVSYIALQGLYPTMGGKAGTGNDSISHGRDFFTLLPAATKSLPSDTGSGANRWLNANGVRATEIPGIAEEGYYKSTLYRDAMIGADRTVNEDGVISAGPAITNSGDFIEIVPEMGTVICNNTTVMQSQYTTGPYSSTSYGGRNLYEGETSPVFIPVDVFYQNTSPTDGYIYMSFASLDRILATLVPIGLGSNAYLMPTQFVAYDQVLDFTGLPGSVGTPEQAGFTNEGIKMIDDFVMMHADTINDAPLGVSVTRYGKMVYSDAKGSTLRYDPSDTARGVLLPPDKRVPASRNTLFDLASNSKMYGATVAIEHLVSLGKMNITDPLNSFKGWENYRDDYRQFNVSAYNGTGTGKDDTTIEHLLLHMAGHNAAPTLERMHAAGSFFFHWDDSKPRQEQVAALIDIFCRLPLQYNVGSTYMYSDADYMILSLLIETITGVPYDKYMEDLYKSMGLYHTAFNPYKKGFGPEDSASTEMLGSSRDGYVSNGYLPDLYTPANVTFDMKQGQVHDERAWYVMGGVSGHAGLFSSPADMAGLTQLAQNGGVLNKKRVFDRAVHNLFTTPSPKAYPPITSGVYTTGLGWRVSNRSNNMFSGGLRTGASAYYSYGHSGWTGTFASVDPVNGMSVVQLIGRFGHIIAGNGESWQEHGNPASGSGSYAGYNAYEIIPVFAYGALKSREGSVRETASAHKVTFDSAGGSFIWPQYVENGGKALEPLYPPKKFGSPSLPAATLNTGARFDGWYTADGAAYDFNHPVTGDITLYARWTNSWSVFFNPNQGTGGPAGRVVSDEGTVGVISTPTLSGFEFGGWFYDYGYNVPFHITDPIKANTVLHAKWTGNITAAANIRVDPPEVGKLPQVNIAKATRNANTTIPAPNIPWIGTISWVDTASNLEVDQFYAGRTYKAVVSLQSVSMTGSMVGGPIPVTIAPKRIYRWDSTALPVINVNGTAITDLGAENIIGADKTPGNILTFEIEFPPLPWGHTGELKLGLERLLEDPVQRAKIAGKNVALYSNQVFVDAQMNSAIKGYANANDFTLVAMFAGEHGVRGQYQAGAVVPNEIDVETGILNWSLYGGTAPRRPTADILRTRNIPASLLSGIPEGTYDTIIDGKYIHENKMIDVVLFDLPDIGSITWTYLFTLADLMKSLVEFEWYYDVNGEPKCTDGSMTLDELKAIPGKQIQLIVLDRPNPLGGLVVEGPVRDTRPTAQGGIGTGDFWRFPIASRYGMTLGELAYMYVGEWEHSWNVSNASNLNPHSTAFQTVPLSYVNMDVIPVQGWTRDMYWDDWDPTGARFIMPSPNMPTWEAAYAYSGTVWHEGTNIGERGTTPVWTLLHAPYVNGYELAARLNSFNLPGVIYRAAANTPINASSQIRNFPGRLSDGVEIHVYDKNAYRAIDDVILQMLVLRTMYGTPGNVNNADVNSFHIAAAMNLRLGNNAIRDAFIQFPLGASNAEIWAEHQRLKGIVEHGDPVTGAPGQDEFLTRRSQYLIAEYGPDYNGKPPVAAAPPEPSVALGYEVLLSSRMELLEDKKIALLADHTSVDKNMNHLVDTLVKEGVNLTALLAPVPGLRGLRQDAVFVGTGANERATYPGGTSYVDIPTNLPVHRLAGSDTVPTAAMLADVDVLLFDLQDSGIRFNSRIELLADVMKACAENDVKLVVLERPSLIDGEVVDGPVSETGSYPIPVRYAMTLGELARMLKFEFGYYTDTNENSLKNLELVVVGMEHWDRTAYSKETGLKYVAPVGASNLVNAQGHISPIVLGTYEAALAYSAVGLIEATTLFDGVGTTRSMETVGAPFVGPGQPLVNFREALRNANLTGVGMRTAVHVPWNHAQLTEHGGKNQNQTIYGVQLHLSDFHAFDSMHTALTLLTTLKAHFPNNVTAQTFPASFDQAAGNTWMKDMILSGRSVLEIKAVYQDDLAAFEAIRAKYLIDIDHLCNYVITSTATCTEGGWKINMCSHCGKVELDEDGEPVTYGWEDALGHLFGQPEPIPGDDDWMIVYCEREGCGHFEYVPAIIPITSLKIHALSIATVARGQVYKFSVLLNEGATDETVEWAIADENLGYVDQDGVVTIFDRIGNVRLTARDSVSGINHSITLRIAS